MLQIIGRLPDRTNVQRGVSTAPRRCKDAARGIAMHTAQASAVAPSAYSWERVPDVYLHGVYCHETYRLEYSPKYKEYRQNRAPEREGKKRFQLTLNMQTRLNARTSQEQQQRK